MSTAKSSTKALSVKWHFIAFTALTLAFSLFVAFGSSVALAAEADKPVAEPVATDTADSVDPDTSNQVSPNTTSPKPATAVSSSAAEPPASSTSAAAPTSSDDALMTAAGEVTAAATGNPAFGDDGTASMYMHTKPSDFPYYSFSNQTPPPDYGAPYYVDPQNITHVYVHGRAGRPLDISSDVDYLRSGDQSKDAYGDYGSFTPPDENTEFYILTSYYFDVPPLPQGAYTSSPEQRTAISSENGTEYGISALAFVPSYAYQFDIPNRFTTANSFHDSIWIPSNQFFNFPELTYFPGEQLIYAQTTFVQATTSTVLDANNQEIENVMYEVCASNIIAYHLYVSPEPFVQVIVNVTDDSGVPVPIEGGTFRIYASAEVHDMDNWNLGLYPTSFTFNESSIILDSVYFPGQVEVSITHQTGEYKPATLTTEITQDEFDAAVNTNSPIVRSIVLEAIEAPIQYTVRFLDTDQATVLSSELYNEGTLGGIVVTPARTPEKAEDEDYAYVFDHWETTDGKRYSQTVMSDMDYIPVFREIPKKNVVATATVHAAGGLFDMDKPAGVSSYGLEESTPAEGEQEQLKQDYATEIGENSVIGVFEVNLKQYNDDGTVTNLSEGIGHLSLSFNVPGVADGTKVRIMQLHKNVSTGLYETIWHNNLVVTDGKVTITLDGRLSTFIITTDEASDDTTPAGGENDPTEQGDTPSNPSDNPGSSDTPTDNPAGQNDATNNTDGGSTQDNDQPATTPDNNAGQSGSTSGADSSDSPAPADSASGTAGQAAGNAQEANSGQQFAHESPLSTLSARIAMPKTGLDEDTAAVKTTEAEEEAVKTGDSTAALALALAILAFASTAVMVRRRRLS